MLQIHKKIELARKAAGLSQEQLADKLEISRSTYQYWEQKTPSIDKIEGVAEALGLQKDYFFVTPDEYFIKQQEVVNPDEKKEAEKITNEGNWLAAFIEEKEARRKEAEQRAELAEKEKDRLLTIIEKNLTELLKATAKIDTNLKETQEDLNEVEFAQRSQHTVMMHSLERLEKKPGALHKELSILERAYLPKGEEGGKNVKRSKRST
jgi:transcriptional regulator with XRE-family HTH domain